MRQVVLDTEVTGLDPALGHRIIEIAAIELHDLRLTGQHMHRYINPQRSIDETAMMVHGLTPEFLSDKPVFSQIAAEVIEFLQGSELVIHNAAFDLAFLDHEFAMLNLPPVCTLCPSVVDTLQIARQHAPGQRNSLDALCSRYKIDNYNSSLHGALLDAQLLAEIYSAHLSVLFAAHVPAVATVEHAPPLQIYSYVKQVEAEMLQHFAKHPEQLHGMLSAREFEQLVAAIFRNNGFSVSLTPATRDGGVDIIAVEHSQLTGETVHLIECKRYAPTRRVGIGVVQRLLGAVTQRRATKGLIVTTSFFSSDAMNAAQDARHILTLSDYNALVGWLRALKQAPRA